MRQVGGAGMYVHAVACVLLLLAAADRWGICPLEDTLAHSAAGTDECISEPTAHVMHVCSERRLYDEKQASTLALRRY
jgi:hypothetical protein